MAKNKKESNDPLDKPKPKKVDYRAWGNKYLKPGANLPPVSKGFGNGKVNYCPKCDMIPRRSRFIDSKWICVDCGTECISKSRLGDDNEIV